MTTVKKHKNKTRWHKSTVLQLQHPLRSIFFEKQTCYMFFSIGKELEGWFLALWRATQIAEQKKVRASWALCNATHPPPHPPQRDAKETEQQRREREFFGVLSNLYKSPGYPIDPVSACWFNALAGRIFWNVHDQNYFIDLLSVKVREKIAKIKRPPYVVRVVDDCC